MSIDLTKPVYFLASVTSDERLGVLGGSNTRADVQRFADMIDAVMFVAVPIALADEKGLADV